MTTRADLGINDMAVVGTEVCAAAGYHLFCEWRLDISMVAALPLMAMSLGVNDVFVIVRYLSELGIDYITDKDETHQRACEAELLACRETMTP